MSPSPAVPFPVQAINATILDGFSHSPLYNNGTLQVPVIDVYGTTHDGAAYYIHEEGIGSNAAQVTRIVSQFRRGGLFRWQD